VDHIIRVAGKDKDLVRGNPPICGLERMCNPDLSSAWESSGNCIIPTIARRRRGKDVIVILRGLGRSLVTEAGQRKELTPETLLMSFLASDGRGLVSLFLVLRDVLIAIEEEVLASDLGLDGGGVLSVLGLGETLLAERSDRMESPLETLGAHVTVTVIKSGFEKIIVSLADDHVISVGSHSYGFGSLAQRVFHGVRYVWYAGCGQKVGSGAHSEMIAPLNRGIEKGTVSPRDFERYWSIRALRPNAVNHFTLPALVFRNVPHLHSRAAMCT
jgi:hypothetical protein